MSTKKYSGISRRDLLLKGGALGIASAVLCATGCSNANTTATANDASSKSASAADANIPSAAEAKAAIGLTEQFYADLMHAIKPPDHQKYIVMHDTEILGTTKDIVDFWVQQGKGIAAHFVVAEDGDVAQVVPLNRIGHHVGFGDTGHDAKFGVEDSLDPATSEPKEGITDHGMNSYSIGIEMIHAEGGDTYPEAQLKSVDKIIAYIDAYFGFECKIIQHRDWRTSNTDCSPAFEGYLKNLQTTRTTDGSDRGWHVPERTY